MKILTGILTNYFRSGASLVDIESKAKFCKEKQRRISYFDFILYAYQHSLKTYVERCLISPVQELYKFLCRIVVITQKHKSWARFVVQMKWNIFKYFQYSVTHITRMEHINCGTPRAILPGANRATPLGKLKTTAFFILAQSTRVLQQGGGGGGGGEELGPHTMQNETL
jgi:hypothetical protein